VNLLTLDGYAKLLGGDKPAPGRAPSLSSPGKPSIETPRKKPWWRDVSAAERSSPSRVSHNLVRDQKKKWWVIIIGIDWVKAARRKRSSASGSPTASGFPDRSCRNGCSSCYPTLIREAASRVVRSMLQMEKLDIATLETAHDG